MLMDDYWLSISGGFVLLAVWYLGGHALLRGLKPHVKFIWHCFLRPIGKADQRARLEAFYEGQADVYDATRVKLLRGRDSMLSLSAAHLRTLRTPNTKKPLIWVDIGGGTGHNIEMMDKHFPISSFDAIYLVDLCEPLLQVARKRFARRGWSNITVLCQDASEFSLPGWSTGVDPKGSVSFITMSYSLSMIPSFYPLLDRIDHVLSPEDGLLGVVDFYTSDRQISLHEKAIGGTSKECSWLTRWFWQIWFDFDHVSLSPHRRNYLEYKFGTVKSYNGRNQFILPFIIRIPYYIWIGRSRTCDVSRFCHAFEVEGGNTVGNCSPTTFTAVKEIDSVPPLDVGESIMTPPREAKPASHTAVIDIKPPLSSFHYQIKNLWRLPYYEHPVHKEFRTFVYSFTWEDPFEDMKHLQLSREDSMFVITSAGDNALHYAIAAKPKRIHCVDMNPCQGHLFELKLAAIQSLPYDDVFAMFGEGRHADFRKLLDSKISPHLSSLAYQFWRINDDAFSSSFYLHGYSGWALRLAKFIFTVAGTLKDVEALCNAESVDVQKKIWFEKLRPAFLNPVVVALLKSPVFCWNALGVPLNQRRMLLNEGSMYDFVRETLDPVSSAYSFKDGAYFYPLALLGHYTKTSCPQYLTREGYNALRADDSEATDAFRLHTDSIINVLRGLNRWSITRALIMDHLDWFAPDSSEVDHEVDEFHRVLASGGFIFWRSAAKKPWYNEVFERKGFKVIAVGIRDGVAALDMVNMYASFWKGVKL